MKRRSITISDIMIPHISATVSEWREDGNVLRLIVANGSMEAKINLTQDELDELLDAIDTLRPARERKKK